MQQLRVVAAEVKVLDAIGARACTWMCSHIESHASSAVIWTAARLRQKCCFPHLAEQTGILHATICSHASRLLSMTRETSGAEVEHKPQSLRQHLCSIHTHNRLHAQSFYLYLYLYTLGADIVRRVCRRALGEPHVDQRCDAQQLRHLHMLLMHHRDRVDAAGARGT